MTGLMETVKYKDVLTRADSGSFAPAGGFVLIREEAGRRFREIGFPTRQNEGWKYLDLNPVLDVPFGALNGKHSLTRDEIDGVLPPNHENKIVFVNGLYSKELSSVHFPEGVIAADLAEAEQKYPELLQNFAAENAVETDPFAAINTFSFKSGLFLFIPDKVMIEGPVHVVLVTPAGAPASAVHPRLFIVAGISTRVNVVVHSIDFGGTGFNNLVSEVHLKQGACMNYFQLQRLGASSRHFSSNRFYLKRHASLEILNFTEGGVVTRHENRVRFEEEHGFASMKGLSLLEKDSKSYAHLVADHRAGQCISRQFYKNILGGRAVSEFNSLVEVHPGAQKSDSQQMNKNLLLSDTAQSYARPQLRINADDVACAHGSATGQMEKSELFYLRSRGLSKELARFVLIYGFADEILGSITDKTLKIYLEGRLDETLERVTQGGKK